MGDDNPAGSVRGSEGDPRKPSGPPKEEEEEEEERDEVEEYDDKWEEGGRKGEGEGAGM